MIIHFENYEIVISEDELNSSISIEDIKSYVKIKYQNKESAIR